MTTKEAIINLENYNQWRLGCIDEMPLTPKEITETIETITKFVNVELNE